MKKKVLTLCASLTLAILAGCSVHTSQPVSSSYTAPVAHNASLPTAPKEGVTGELVIPGTGDSQDLLRNIAKVYEKSNPQAKVTIPDSTGSFATKPGTLGGLESAGTRTTALGRTAVRPREEDLKKFGPMYYREFARVPVAFVVHKSVSVRELTSKDICDIYAGRVTNWQQVGGLDMPIAVQTRPEGSNMIALRQGLPCFKELKVTDKGHHNLRNADAINSMRDRVGAIGFMPLSEADHYKYTMLKIDGKYPFSEGYPVTVGLGLVHRDPLNGLARNSVDFLASEEVSKVLRYSGHLPVKMESELVELKK